MSKTLHGLPSRMAITRFLSDYADRSGFLDHYGWSKDACDALSKEVRALMDSGKIRILPDPAFKAVVLNTNSRLTASNKVPLEPRLLRHSARAEGLSEPLEEEMEFLNQTAWNLNPQMVAMLSTAKVDGPVATMLAKVPNFLVAADEIGDQVFYIPVFFDRVRRLYGEGEFSYTGNKLVRWCLDFAKKSEYSLGAAKKILAKVGIDWRQAKPRLADWQDWVKTEKDIFRLRAYLFYLEVEEMGESGWPLGGDMLTSGMTLGSILAGDLSLMRDCCIWDEDGRDCRRSVGQAVLVPALLEPWAEFIRSKDAAKPLITRLYYGEAADSGAQGMFWEDPDRAPVGWRSAFGVINPDVCIKKRSAWNADWAHIIDAVGPKAAFAAFKEVSTSYNGTFWGAYPSVRSLRQKVADAFQSARDNGLECQFHLPHGVVYTHHKWEIDPNGDTWRFRHKADYLAEAGWQHGIDISLKGMVDVAGGHSLFVRIVHALDAWFRHRVNMKIRAMQRKLFGMEIGAASVHDFFMVPAAQALHLEGIVRAVLHECVEIFPTLINDFLTSYGQEPMKPWTKQQRETVHKAISRNRGYFTLGA